jgi:SAM-dependent MidA family methyltransferase
MDPDVVRRAAGADEPLPPSDPVLLDRIRSEIARSGPMPFPRFMELALYDPEHGYYLSDAARVGRGGADFLTAPETHPIFGAAVARSVASVWRRLGESPSFVVREYGAGRGTLATSIVQALAADEPRLAAALRYEAVEINPHRRAEIGSAAVVPLSPAEAAAAPPTPSGYVLANEFLDAFPVHRLIRTAKGLREIHVDTEPGTDRLREVAGPLTDPALEHRLEDEGIDLAEGSQAEVAEGLGQWFEEVGRWLTAGVATIVDYGDDAAKLYDERHARGTLLGYAGHRAVDDPPASVGRQDLTAHVDFTAAVRAANLAGLTTFGRTTQARFLVDLGLEALLETARSAAHDPQAWLALRSGVVRLLDPRHMGGFGVLVVGRGLHGTEPLPGLRQPGERPGT